MTIGLVYVKKSKSKNQPVSSIWKKSESKNWLVLGIWKISDSKKPVVVPSSFVKKI
jgi:hypothetical protein